MRRVCVVDVFSPVEFGGNPLAVVVDAEGMSDEDMQRFTRWMNLSETAFLLPPTMPEADYRVRIFTLAKELPFAGHPTLGSCHTWLSQGRRPQGDDRIVQECGAGLIEIRRSGDELAFAAPPLLRSGPVDAELADQLPAIIGVSADQIVASQWIDNGPGWLGVLLVDAATVLAARPDFGRYRGDGRLDIGLIGPHPAGCEWAFEIRGLFSDESGALREDPVTGSLNASAAQWLFASGRASSPYVARQGTVLGRDGRIHLRQDADGQVWVGGTSVTRIDGVLHR